MEEKKEISVYNEAVQQVMRIGNHWVEIAKLRERGKLNRVKFKLDSVEAEFKYDILHTLKADGYEEKLKNVNQKIREASIRLSQYIKKHGQVEMEILENVYNQHLYEPLIEKEELLREIQQKSGKGSSYKGTDEEDMD